MDRFLRAGTAVLTTRGSEISALDMRYSNGFSVSWRAPGAPTAQVTPAATEQNMVKEPDNDV